MATRSFTATQTAATCFIYNGHLVPHHAFTPELSTMVTWCRITRLHQNYLQHFTDTAFSAPTITPVLMQQHNPAFTPACSPGFGNTLRPPQWTPLHGSTTMIIPVLMRHHAFTPGFQPGLFQHFPASSMDASSRLNCHDHPGTDAASRFYTRLPTRIFNTFRPPQWTPLHGSTAMFTAQLPSLPRY